MTNCHYGITHLLESATVLPVFKGRVMEYGYKGRGTVTLSNGKNLALRYSPDDKDKRVPKSGDAIRCQIFHSEEFGPMVVDWSFQVNTTRRLLYLIRTEGPNN